MSKPKKRRVLLPILSALTLLSVAGGTGYWYFASSTANSTAEEAASQSFGELEAGFAAASTPGASPRSASDSAASDEVTSSESTNSSFDRFAAAMQNQFPRSAPSAVSEATSSSQLPLPPVEPSSSRYADSHYPEPPVDNSRYTAQTPSAAAPTPQEVQDLADDEDTTNGTADLAMLAAAPLPAPPEPHTATSYPEQEEQNVVARGQSPSPFDQLPSSPSSRYDQAPQAQPMASQQTLPAANPLRGGVSPSTSPATEAFAEPSQLPAGADAALQRSLDSDPPPSFAGNPLRSLSPQPASREAVPAPMESIPSAQPLSGADRFQHPTQMSELAPIQPLESPRNSRSREEGLRGEEGMRSVLVASQALPEHQRLRLEQTAPPTPSGDRWDDLPHNNNLPRHRDQYESEQRLATSITQTLDEGTGRPGEQALEGPQRPSLVMQKFAPEEIQVGKPCTFAIKLRNTGQRPAENVVLEDDVPQGARFISASLQPTISGSHLVWQLGTLSPGEERSVEIELEPTTEGEIGSVATVSFASSVSAKARCTRPQLAVRMTAPAQVLVGRQQKVQIEIHNPGTGDATNVLLLENVPENMQHQAGTALEMTIGTLQAGETRRMELLLTAEKPGRVVNVVTARADGNLQVQQEVEFEVIAPALAVDLEGPTQRYLERPATYTVSVNNPGTAAAKDVQLVTKLPRGMQFVRANNLGEYDSATHSVYWSLAELPEGQQGTVELTAMPVQAGEQTLEVEGRAREGLEDRTQRQVRVEGLAAIQFEVSDAQDPIEVGGSTSYQIRVINQGTKAASNVRVRVVVPPDMQVTGANGETRYNVEAEGVLFAPLSRLAPKAESVYQVQVRGVRAGDQRVLVEVSTDDISQPVRKEESTRVFGDQ